MVFFEGGGINMLWLINFALNNFVIIIVNLQFTHCGRGEGSKICDIISRGDGSVDVWQGGRGWMLLSKSLMQILDSPLWCSSPNPKVDGPWVCCSTTDKEVTAVAAVLRINSSELTVWILPNYGKLEIFWVHDILVCSVNCDQIILLGWIGASLGLALLLQSHLLILPLFWWAPTIDSSLQISPPRLHVV